MPNKPSSQLSNYLITSKVIRADKSLRPDAIAITLHIGASAARYNCLIRALIGDCLRFGLFMLSAWSLGKQFVGV